MSELLRLLIWWACVLFVGWSALSFISRRGSLFPVEKAALSYGLGAGIISAEMAVLSMFGIKFSVFSLMIWWLPVMAASVFLSIRNRKAVNDIATVNVPLTAVEILLTAGITIEIAYTFFRALLSPLEAYDAIAIYGLKSKIFYLAGTVPHDFLNGFRGYVPHIEYPLLIPLAETFFYTFIGSLNDVLVKIIFPLYYLAALAVLYFVCLRFTGRKTALLFTFLLATIPQFTDFAVNGYADIPFAFYCSASIFYLYLWARKKEVSFLVLSFVLSCLATWTKSEGLMFAAVNILVAVVGMVRAGKFSKPAVIYSSAIFLTVITYLFSLYRITGSLPQSDFASGPALNAQNLAAGIRKLPAILYAYQIQFFGPKKWNIIWILFIIALLVRFKKALYENILWLTSAILLVFAGYTLIYMNSPDLSWHLDTTVSRLFIHFLPVVVLWLALMFKEEGLEL